MKYPLYCILIFITLLLSSCFEVIEDIAVHTDGSGSYKFIVNLSQSKNQIDKIRTQDSILKFKVPQTADVDTKLNEIKTKLAAINGISDVSLKSDHINYIYQLSCGFKDVAALNNAIHTLWKSYDKNAPATFNLYSYENHVFKRNTAAAPVDHIIKNAGSQEIDMCQKASYTVICRFDTPISGNSSMSYSLSPSKKGALYKNSLWTTIADKTQSNTTITITE